MSHANGKIYSEVVNGKKVGINSDDIVAVLGENSHDWGTLCGSRKINKWAFFKPYAIGFHPEDITNEERYACNFGLEPPKIFTSKDALIAAFTSNLGGGGVGGNAGSWNYKHVGENDSARITDFDGYDHNAKSPFGALYGPIDYIQKPSKSLVISAQTPLTASDGTSITLANFKMTDDYGNRLYFGDWYYTLYIVSKNGSHSWIASSASTVKEHNGWQVDFGNIVNGTGYDTEYLIYPFLSDKKWIIGQDLPIFRAVTIEDSGVSLIVKSQNLAYLITVRCLWRLDNALSYDITIENTTANDVTFYDTYLKLATDTIGSNETVVKNFGAVVVKAGDTWTAKGVEDVPAPGFAASSYYNAYSFQYRGQSVKSWNVFLKPALPPSEIITT